MFGETLLVMFCPLALSWVYDEWFYVNHSVFVFF